MAIGREWWGVMVQKGDSPDRRVKGVGLKAAASG
jgi:hypothetical protein